MPVGGTLPTSATDAVRVTDCPTATGFGVAVRATCDEDNAVPAALLQRADRWRVGAEGRLLCLLSRFGMATPAPMRGLLEEGAKL